MSSRDCCKDGTSRPDFDPKRNFMGQPWLDHEDSTPPLSYLDQASAAPLFGHAPCSALVYQGVKLRPVEVKVHVFTSTAVLSRSVTLPPHTHPEDRKRSESAAAAF